LVVYQERVILGDFTYDGQKYRIKISRHLLTERVSYLVFFEKPTGRTLEPSRQ
jgi:hypothetical protein